ncbi:hypothetical protein [Plantactinospora soyae]|uniref:Uncharacterized protein n=1 Tax=Plantactinospora soyae TaxID=1544732 RepID=A0A927R3L0_9ACTN|nr:hypothetical protein [Plantactinospora soyae]MBE1485609.1 hypothetical protein [Plantactinospora soyae]
MGNIEYAYLHLFPQGTGRHLKYKGELEDMRGVQKLRGDNFLALLNAVGAERWTVWKRADDLVPPAMWAPIIDRLMPSRPESTWTLILRR